MGLRLRSAPLGMVALFSIVIAMMIGAGAVTVADELATAVESSALAGAEATADVFTRLSLEAEEYANGAPTAEGLEDIEHNLELSDSIVGVALWSRSHTVRLRVGRTSGRGARTARDAQTDAGIASALGGRTVSKVRHLDGGEDTVSVFVPVVLTEGGAPVGVLESFFPHGPVDATIASRTNRIYWLVGIAALLLYVALIPVLLRAGRVLQSARMARHVELQRALRSAMERGELELHYQPKLTLAGGQPDSVEALLRWRHPKRGMVPPLDFLPAIERTPMIGPLTLHVFRLACAQVAQWRRSGRDLEVAVNLSPANLQDDSLALDLAAILAEHGVDARAFTLEITESGVVEHSTTVETLLASLSSMGFRLSIDDFGTGHSSLARLDGLPFDELKIDRSLVRTVERDSDGRIVTAITRLAGALGITTVAEGIESAAVAERVRELGCDVGQGFHWSRPLPAHELEAWLDERDTVSVRPAPATAPLPAPAPLRASAV